MAKFLVHTDVTARELGPMEFSVSVPKLLAEAHISNVQFTKAQICNLSICHCLKDRKMMCEFDSADENTVRNALQKIGLPIAAILAKPN